MPFWIFETEGQAEEMNEIKNDGSLDGELWMGQDAPVIFQLWDLLGCLMSMEVVSRSPPHDPDCLCSLDQRTNGITIPGSSQKGTFQLPAQTHWTRNHV